MADDPGKTFRDRIQSAADKGMEIYERNKRYKPNREADKYILQRTLENVPGMRPSNDPGREVAPKKHQYGEGYEYIRQKQLDGDAEGDHFRPKTRAQLLEGWKEFEEDINTLSDYDKRPRPKTHNPQETAADSRLERSLGFNTAWARQLAIGSSAGHGLTPRESKYIQDLEADLAELYTAPGAQKDRAGRIQEIVEAMDLTNPESASRAGLRQLGRLMIDDQVPRVAAGYKTQTGEEFMLGKLQELGLTDTPQARKLVLNSIGATKLPDTMPLLDASGKRVTLYQDEIQAAGDAAREKAYLNRRRDPMRDTPERD